MKQIRPALMFTLALAFTACGPKRLPKLPDPPPVMPAVDLTAIPPEPGTGQVVLDTLDGPARVIEVLSSESSFGTASVGLSTAIAYGYSERRANVCVTPCVANLRHGSRTLTFASLGDPERSSTFDVQVTTKPMVHRVNPGKITGSDGRFVGGLVLAGLAGAAAGSLILVGGLSGNDTALGIGIGSAGLALLGGLLYNSGRSEITPGGITSFAVEGAN